MKQIFTPKIDSKLTTVKGGQLALYISFMIYTVYFGQRRDELVWSNTLINVVPVRNTFTWFQSLENQPIKNWLEFYYNFLGNIILFVPFSLFALSFFKIQTRVIIIGAGSVLSILIEFTQYCWRIGVPDIDDVLLNTTGVIVGIFLWSTLLKKQVKALN